MLETTRTIPCLNYEVKEIRHRAAADFEAVEVVEVVEVVDTDIRNNASTGRRLPWSELLGHRRLEEGPAEPTGRTLIDEVFGLAGPPSPMIVEVHELVQAER